MLVFFDVLLLLSKTFGVLTFSRLTKCVRFWGPECLRSIVRMLTISQNSAEPAGREHMPRKAFTKVG